jgi:alkylation response protein AidB-like acyl-CoA dehydrogenase
MTSEVAELSTDVEDVESFTARARKWLSENMPRESGGGMLGFRTSRSDEEELARIARCRELRQMLFDGGLTGICVPREYGGQGLTPAHQAALNQEIVGYDYPAETEIPTFTPCMAVILEFGTHEQKLRHIPGILKGEELWMQFLSEPSGGSDVAGAQTTAVRDGEEWVLNGSKIWTTGAWWADWGLCLARTNWDVPKHRGLSVFMLKIHQPGIEIHRIEMLNGSREFCQEFITDVRIPDGDRIGEVDQGWTVGTRWMYHERTVSGGSPYVTRAGWAPCPRAQPASFGWLGRTASSRAGGRGSSSASPMPVTWSAPSSPPGSRVRSAQAQPPIRRPRSRACTRGRTRFETPPSDSSSLGALGSPGRRTNRPRVASRS